MCILYLWTSPGEEIYAQTPESPVKPNNGAVNQPEPTPSAEENQKINQKPPEPEGDANCKNPACYPFMFGSIPATGVLGIKYIHLYIPFTGYGADTYNSYLERQFGHKGAVLYGIQLMLGIKLLKPMETIDRAEINLELFEGSTKLKYNDLNGLEKQNDLTVSYQQITLNLFHQMNRYLGAAESGNAVIPFQHYIQLGGGIGYNTVTRNFYGTSTNSIVTTNLTKNQGKAEAKTNAVHYLLNAGYALSMYEQYNLNILYGYIYSVHNIPKEDRRPGRNETNIISDTEFYINSFYYSIGFNYSL